MLEPSLPPLAGSSFSSPVKSSFFRSLVLPTVLMMLMLLIGYSSYYASETSGIASLQENGARQLELQARAVESEIGKYTFLPTLLELESSVEDLLENPTPALRRQVNVYLEGLNNRSGSRVVYVLDNTGRVLAASNWRDADSYVDENLAWRTYFQQAMQGQAGRFYGIGSTIGEPGYYLAHGLKKQGKIIGVAVVKVRLEFLEARWQRAQLQAFVSDENSIIILSSEPQWKLHAVTPLTPDKREQLARSLQYYWWALSDLNTAQRVTIAPGVERMTFQTGEGVRQTQVNYLAQTRRLSDTPWHFTLLTPLVEVRRNAASHAALAAVLFAFIAFLLIAWNERRKVIATRLAAREALQQANNELERKIAERTADLQASNARLTAEVHEREQAETTLRRAQNELIQAGKLAVIGQMSTSIAHELNQPLAALRTLSGNTIRFLERGALDTASANLRTINDLVDRMGKITGSLRSFARRAESASGPAHLQQAVESALFLLHPRLGKMALEVRREFTDAELAIDQTRLEQILVNLFSNALDAMQDQPEHILTLSGQAEGGHYDFQVHDTGSGLPEAVLQSLFEPFFTTKPAPHGLGLGLTLSASLAAEVGGSLHATSPEHGGATFILTLPLVTKANDHDQ